MLRGRPWFRGGGLACVVVLGVFAGGAFGHGDLHERIVVLTERLSATPEDAELYLKRADLHRQHGAYVPALGDLDEAARIGGREAAVLLLRGRTLLDCACDRDGEAVEALVEFVEMRPEHAEGRMLLARARARAGDRAGAIVEYGRAIDLYAEVRPEVYLERADLVAEGGDEEALESALLGVEEGIERLGSVVTLELRAMELERELGRIDAAVARIGRVMERASRKDHWLALQGRVLAEAGRTAEALAAYRSALASIDGLERRVRDRVRVRAARAAIEIEMERLEGVGEREEEVNDAMEKRDADE